MRNIAIIALSVLLVASIVFCSIFYPKYLDTKDELSTSEKQSTRLKEENSAMKSQIQKYTAISEELKKANMNISELTNTVKEKEQTLSEYEEKLNTTEKAFEQKKKEEKILRAELEEKLGNLLSDFEEKKKVEETLRAELSSKDETVAELQEELNTYKSHLLQVDDERARRRKEIETLRLTLVDLKGEKAFAVTRLGTLKSTYEDLISDLKKQIEQQEVTIKAYEEKISVAFVDRILFDFGKATISSEGDEILRKVGSILKDVEEKQIRVIGHTDNIPILPGFRHKYPSNWELSAARAAAVVRYFQNTMDLDPSKLEAVGRSYYEPVASNETEEGRARNRRVNIIIAPNIE